MEMPKAELISKLISDEEDERLMADSRWQLRAKLVDWRFVAFSHFMLDVHDQLAIISKSFQSNSLIVYDISRNINKTLKQLKKLSEGKGSTEASFWAEVKETTSSGRDMLRTCQLVDGTTGREALKIDRKQVLNALDAHLIERYQKVLNDPVLLALTSFDHTRWPRKVSAAPLAVWLSTHYYSLLLTTTHYLLTTTHYYSLPLTTTHYYSLLLTTTHYYSLPLTTTHYYSLLLTTTHYYSLHCRLLPYLLPCVLPYLPHRRACWTACTTRTSKHSTRRTCDSLSPPRPLMSCSSSGTR